MNCRDLDSLIRGKKINFLIGAGASVPMYPALSLGEDMPTFEEIVSHENITEETKRFLYVYYFEKWIDMMGERKEDFLRRAKISDVFTNYRRLIQWMYDFLQCESNESPKRINIFTTNYDLIFERAFDEFLCENPLIFFNDGSRGFFEKYISNRNFYLNITHSGYNDNYRREVPTINLFKLHGSVSWKLKQNKIIVDEQNSIINEIRERAEALSLEVSEIEKIISTDKCIRFALSDFVENLNESVHELDLDNNKLKDFFEAYSELPIINPDKFKFFKSVSEQHYYQLIRSFSYELEQKQSVLIVFGFSFADEHIRDIFERSLLNPELEVILITYSRESQSQLKTYFTGYKNIMFLPENPDSISGNFKYLLGLLGDGYDS